MRVLVCSDEVGGLTSADAGRCLAQGWADHRTAVVPLGEAGGGFVAATAASWRVPEEPMVADGRIGVRAIGPVGCAVSLAGGGPYEGPIPYAVSSRPLGLALAGAAERTSGAVLVDLVAGDVHDGGAGLLAALGARADADLDHGVDGLAGLTRLDLTGPRERLSGRDLVGVVPTGQLQTPLLGLRGITSVRGRASGDDPARLLAADADLERFAVLAGPDLGSAAGAGACGGTGLAVLALGGRLATGPSLALDAIRGPVDLVVTGCSTFDFAHRGGGVVAAAAALAGRLLAPCVVIAGEVLIGAREMRTMGVEAAYAVREVVAGEPTQTVGAEELTKTAHRVARSWTW